MNRFESLEVQRKLDIGISKMIWRTIDRYIERYKNNQDKLKTFNINIIGNYKRVIVDINNCEYRAAFEYDIPIDLKLKYIDKGNAQYLALSNEDIGDDKNVNICNE